TWTEHVSSRSALREPVCMASLIASKRNQNSLKKDLLIFSNPDTEKQRKDITIKVSLDGGVTWLPENQVLLDEGYGWGYSCLSMVDKDNVGIIYEGSQAHMIFQVVPLKELVQVTK
ncbi:MAG: sialidase, partial [Tannerellaceae bacterium]